MSDNFQTKQYVKNGDANNRQEYIKHYLEATEKLKERLILQIKRVGISNLDIEISYDTEYTQIEKANASFEYNGIKYNIDLKGQNFYYIETKDDTNAMKITEATIILNNENNMIDYIKSQINQIIEKT